MNTKDAIKFWARWIPFIAGYAMGWFLGIFFGAKRIAEAVETKFMELEDQELKKLRRERNAAASIDDRIRTAADHYGFRPMSLLPTVPDNRLRSASDVISTLMRTAGNCHFQEREQGRFVSEISAWTTLWTANRGILVKTGVTIAPSDSSPGMIDVRLPDAERDRLGNLDRAMKCFLN